MRKSLVIISIIFCFLGCEKDYSIGYVPYEEPVAEPVAEPYVAPQPEEEPYSGARFQCLQECR